MASGQIVVDEVDSHGHLTGDGGFMHFDSMDNLKEWLHRNLHARTTRTYMVYESKTVILAQSKVSVTIENIEPEVMTARQIPPG